MIQKMPVTSVPVFGPALFPPIRYFSHLIEGSDALIEANCHYSRQTYRNRYLILGANGVMPLSVPVEKISGTKICTKDVLVSYDTPWKELHWKSIVSAYNASPYFQYYDMDVEAIFKRKWKYLLDMNLQSVQIILDCLGLSTKISLTNEYHSTDYYLNDFREIIHPKKEQNIDNDFRIIPYRQVFGEKLGFTGNLSMLDLLFNKGPESLLILRDSLI